MLALLALEFIIYGALGWIVECIFTGIKSLLQNDKSGTCTTYIWMPIGYGSAGVLMAHADLNIFGNLFIIYTCELVYGYALKRILGTCPWEYKKGLHLFGLIRVDYCLYWLIPAYAISKIAPSTQSILFALLT